MSDNCDHNFGTFDDFGVKNDQKVSYNMILMSKYKGQPGEKKGQKIRARPPPPFRAMPERNRFFLCEVFPKSQLHLNIYALGHHNGFFDQLFCRPQALLHHGPSLAGYSTLCEL